jgi:hypothetical protein
LECHPKLKENSQSKSFWYGHTSTHLAGVSAVEQLKLTDFSSPNQSELTLLEGVDKENINFSPIFELAVELFTHLGVVCMCPPLFC